MNGKTILAFAAAAVVGSALGYGYYVYSVARALGAAMQSAENSVNT